LPPHAGLIWPCAATSAPGQMLLHSARAAARVQPPWRVTSCGYRAPMLFRHGCYASVQALPLRRRDGQDTSSPTRPAQSSAELRPPIPSHLSPTVCHASPLLHQSCCVALAPCCRRARALRAHPRAASHADNCIRTGLQLRARATPPLALLPCRAHACACPQLCAHVHVSALPCQALPRTERQRQTVPSPLHDRGYKKCSPSCLFVRLLPPLVRR
jgi:hypothetical protein